jgi:ATP-dependent helicase/nuclease subunit B
MTAIAETAPAAAPGGVLAHWRALLARVDAELRTLAAHPARSVVLLPYAQLLPLAAQQWAAQFPDSIAPRFETTRSWATSAAGFAPGPHDLTFDHGRDLLTAAALLEGAGLAAQRTLLAGPLVEQASQLGTVAGSLPPPLRPGWAAQARGALPGDGPLALEAALGRIAIAWASHSDYATDVLFGPRVDAALDALFIVPGLAPDPLTETLAQHFFEKAVLLPAHWDAPLGQIALHACQDAEDEAERAAACVLRHLHAGRVPVALVSGDRLLTRRISALLAARGVRPGTELRDETGWKLSTTHAAAQLMATLRACAPRASTDDVLDWLKLAPVFDAGQQRRLERALRRDAVRGWPQAALLTQQDALTGLIETLRAPMAAARPLVDWLAALRALLQACDLWPALSADVAGCAVIDALALDDEGLADWREWSAAQRRMGLSEFTRWVSDALEAASFRPPHPAQAQVVVLPMNLLAGRPFAALVLPGADEQRLPAAPEPPGPWSAAQRQALHLPTRDDLRHAQAAAWQLALRVPEVDVLWRKGDDNGEPLLPSALVQSLQIQELSAPAAEARTPRFIPIQPVPRPLPRGDALPAQPLSASGYEMLRACPYRFFALRQLGLADESELDVDVDKRDWGNWVHAVLRAFHEALCAAPHADRQALMAAAAEEATRAVGQGVEPAEFMPFAVAWPTLRDAYLEWLAMHEAGGAVFERAELPVDAERGALRLRGQIDRVDHLADGAPLLIDYKTEPAARTRDRVKAGSEDTQLPFYALLSGADAPRAAYLNLTEREAPTLQELKHLPELAALLYEGMAHDVARIAAGDPLPALGEGSVCDWCEARGLCRKDFWSGS